MAAAVGAAGLEAVGTKFISALGSQDWKELQSCFADDVQFRAIIPPGFREGTDAESAVGHLRRWFGDADELVLLSSDVQLMEDRLSISYRFRLHEDQWYIAEQRAYCDVLGDRIQRMDLLCSGFRPQQQ